MRGLIAHVDTLRRRIALTIVAAMLASLVLYALFVQVAGVWAKPPVDQIGLLDQIAATTRIIQAAPPQLREQLSAAASNPALGVLWSEHRSSFELPANGTSIDLDKSPVLHQLLGEAEHKIEVFQPANWPAESSQARYVLLMQLNDGSWLSFTPPQRSWGMSAALRFAVVVALGLVAAWLVARFATRQLADPLQRFTSAVQRFGTDLNAPAIEIEGPREIRQAIIAYNTMQAKIQQFIAERTLMLASISHDLRAPFIAEAVQGFGQFFGIIQLDGRIAAVLPTRDGIRGHSDHRGQVQLGEPLLLAHGADLVAVDINTVARVHHCLVTGSVIEGQTCAGVPPNINACKNTPSACPCLQNPLGTRQIRDACQHLPAIWI